MNDLTKEELCACQYLTLPRWDIYMCPRCDRKLAFFTPINHPSLSLIKKMKKWQLYVFKQEQ